MSAADSTPQALSLRRVDAYHQLHILRNSDSKIHLPDRAPVDIVMLIQQMVAVGKSEISDLYLDKLVDSFMRNPFNGVRGDFVSQVATFVKRILLGYKMRTYEPPQPDGWGSFMSLVAKDMAADLALAKRKFQLYERLGLISCGAEGFTAIFAGQDIASAGIGLGIYPISPELWDDVQMRRYIIVAKADQALADHKLAALGDVIDELIDHPNVKNLTLTQILDVKQIGTFGHYPMYSHQDWVVRLTNDLKNPRSKSVQATKEREMTPVTSAPATTSAPAITPAPATTPPNIFFNVKKGCIRGGIYELTNINDVELTPKLEDNGLWTLIPSADCTKFITVTPCVSPFASETKPWIRMAADFEKRRDPAKRYLFVSGNSDPSSPAVVLYHLLKDA